MRHPLFVNGALLALALGTLGVVWATRESPTTSELAARKNRLLPTFDKEAVSRVAFSIGGHELLLERSAASEFRLVKPWSERADVATVNQLLSSLDTASTLRRADGVSDAQAGFTEQTLRIRLEMGSSAVTLRLGGPAPTPSGARYAEVQSADVATRYVVGQDVAAGLDLAPDKFREPRLLEYGRSELAKLELRHDQDVLELSQAQHGTFFVRVGTGQELAERETVERILTALSRLATEHFVEVDEARKALAASQLHVTLTLTDKQAAPVSLAFGTCPGAGADALVLKEQAGSAPRAGCVPADLVTALGAKLEDARLHGPFAARTDEVEELRIARGEQKLDLARKDKAFVLRAPGNSEVPLDAGNARISQILAAKGERIAAVRLAELGLEPAIGDVSIQMSGADESQHRSEQVLVGKTRPDGSVCVKRNADAVVLCFGAEAARAFEPDTTSLKGLTLFGFAPSEVASFTIQGPSLRETIQRSQDGTYTLEEPRGYRHDSSLVADAIQTLGTLQAVRWVARPDEASTGLAAPRLKATVVLTAGAGTRELTVGAATAGGFFARASSDPGVFVVSRAVVDELSTPLIERSLVPAPEADLTQIQLEGRGHNLTMIRAAERWSGPLDDDTLEAILALKAEQTVHLGGPKPTEGFAKPQLVVRFGTKAGGQVRLLLGATDTLDDTPIAYARLEGVDATFALSGRTAAMLRDSLAPHQQ